MLLYIYSKAPKKREQVNFTTILLLDLIFSSMLSLFRIEFCYSHLKSDSISPKTRSNSIVNEYVIIII